MNIYDKKLKNLSDQINIMLQEANMMPEILGKDPSDGLNEVIARGMKDKDIGKRIYKETLKANEALRKNKPLTQAKTTEEELEKKSKMPITQGELDLMDDADTYGAKAAVLGLTASVVAAIPVVSSFCTGVEQVQNITASAINASNYQDFTKFVQSLKKIKSDNSIWASLTTSTNAKALAGENLQTIQRGYVAIGIAMILVSLVLAFLAGMKLDIVGAIKDAIKNVNTTNILKVLGKVVAVSALFLPAVVGTAMLVVVFGGFSNSGVAAEILKKFYPIVKVSNKLIDVVTKVSVKAAAQKVSSIKRMKSVKK